MDWKTEVAADLPPAGAAAVCLPANNGVTVVKQRIGQFLEVATGGSVKKMTDDRQAGEARKSPPSAGHSLLLQSVIGLPPEKLLFLCI